MAKKQTRRSISLSYWIYKLLLDYSIKEKSSMSRVVESRVIDLFDSESIARFKYEIGDSLEGRKFRSSEELCPICKSEYHHHTKCPKRINGRTYCSICWKPGHRTSSHEKVILEAKINEDENNNLDYQSALRKSKFPIKEIENPCRDPKCNIIALHESHIKYRK